MSDMPVQPVPCRGCPFAGKSAVEAALAVEPGDDCAMLCHESGCLDGDGPDVLCRGFLDVMEGT